MTLPPRSITRRWAITFVALALIAAPAAAQRVRQISVFDNHDLEGYAVDDAGSVAFYVADVDPLGANPGLVMQVFKRALPGGLPVQVTTLDVDAYSVSVSDDGGTILFGSGADPLGTNPDGSPELFLADASGGSMIQLTDHPAGVGVDEAVLSGDGSTALFVSDGDLTGGNPSLVPQLFAIDTDGTNLRQLTSAAVIGDCGDFAISDDGQRIVFADDRDLTGGNPERSRELFAVAGDGTGLAQITSDAYIRAATISGPGNLIVYVTNYDLCRTDWGSTEHTLLAQTVRRASVPDSEDRIYYSTASNWADIYRIDLDDGPGAVEETRKPGDPPEPIEIWVSWDFDAKRPIISGDGTRLLFTLSGEAAPFLTNPDALELLATDGDGLSPEQIVDVGEKGLVPSFEMTADGSRIVFPWGEGVYYDSLDLFLADTESGEVTQVTNRAESANPSISDDGNTIVFTSAAPLVPELCDLDGIYRVSADGSGLQQLVPDPVTCESGSIPVADHAAVSNDGTTVTFQLYSSADLGGVAATGGPVWPVTNDEDTLYKTPRIDGTGTWAAYMSGSDITGQNPDRNWEIFRIRMDGTGLQQITADPDYGSMQPDISANGERIVYGSPADPLGTNPEHNHEIFLRDTTTGITEQLTVTTEGENRYPRISPNGAFVAFYSTSPWVSTSSLSDLYRLELATGELLLASAGVGFINGSVRNNLNLDVDDAGNVAFCSRADLVGLNRDLSIELWLAEFDVAPSFHFADGDPTLVQWDPSPWALGYDVIRGDLASLAAGVGGTVDLGVVVCIEDDSSDAMTTADDSAELAPGEGFFYLYRGDPGDLIGPGSWGEGMGGAERVPAGGECPGGP
jgi:Tol biopolymer transport system component